MPVMKITGAAIAPVVVLSLRHVSNPSSPGIIASSKMTSGCTLWAKSMPSSPERATRTVMPFSSSARDTSPSVSGASSITRAMKRLAETGLDRVSACILHHLLQQAGRPRQIKRIEIATQTRDLSGLGLVPARRRIEFPSESSGMADLGQPDHPLQRLARNATGLCGLLCVVGGQIHLHQPGHADQKIAQRIGFDDERIIELTAVDGLPRLQRVAGHNHDRRRHMRSPV